MPLSFSWEAPPLRPVGLAGRKREPGSGSMNVVFLAFLGGLLGAVTGWGRRSGAEPEWERLRGKVLSAAELGGALRALDEVWMAVGSIAVTSNKEGNPAGKAYAGRNLTR